MSRERNGLSKESEVPGESGKEKTGSGRGAAGPDREADTAAILAPLADDPRTLRMKRFIQHGRITTYDHCMAVARLSDRIDRTLHLHSHRSDLIRGAFLTIITCMTGTCTATVCTDFTIPQSPAAGPRRTLIWTRGKKRSSGAICGR